MLGGKTSHRGISTMGNNNKIGDQMGLKHTNESNKSKSVIHSNKDITNYKPLGKN